MAFRSLSYKSFLSDSNICVPRSTKRRRLQVESMVDGSSNNPEYPTVVRVKKLHLANRPTQCALLFCNATSTVDWLDRTTLFLTVVILCNASTVFNSLKPYTCMCPCKRWPFWTFFKAANKRIPFSTDVEITVQDLIDRCDCRLFKQLQRPTHCLNHLLPPVSSASSYYNLRPRGHMLALPLVKTSRHMNSFVPRTLFKFK